MKRLAFYSIVGQAFVAMVLGACGSASGSSRACGRVGKMEMVHAADYAPCATEIVAALDSLRPPLEEFLAGDDAARDRARIAYGRLRGLVHQTRMARDFRSMRPGDEVVRWPDAGTRAFNAAVFEALVMYTPALGWKRSADVDPGTRENFQQGRKAHDEARQLLGQIH